MPIWQRVDHCRFDFHRCHFGGHESLLGSVKCLKSFHNNS